MDRKEYESYLSHFNGKDYDGVADFYAQPLDMDFFGVKITSREGLKEFYGFLHAHIIETVSVLNFASSETLAAVDGIVRVECIKDLPSETLKERGMEQFHPMQVGDIIEMRQFIFYTLRDGKIAKVECALA